MIRRGLIAAAMACAGASSADRLITIPTARKLPWNDVRLEALAETSRARTRQYGLAIGVTQSFETEIRVHQYAHQAASATLDIGYNYIPPLTGLSPGISFGVQDVLDQSADRTRVYAAITYRRDVYTFNGVFPLDLTAGLFVGHYTSPFIGLSVPFSHHFRGMAEYNGRRFSAGFELRLSKQLGFRLIYEQKDVLLGLQLSNRF